MINDPAHSTQSLTIDDWVEKLRVQELPIFSNTAHSIYKSLNDSNKGALELAGIILQDPNLTAKLLKVGNSPYYNPSKQKMSTVSRAIIILGAEVIRELTLACSFFESILSFTHKERANQEIALAIHSAVQARELSILIKDSFPEEIFVAALLQNIGHIAFWCTDCKQADQIIELIDNQQYSIHDAEKKVLGFTLVELSKKLSKSWHFGGLIEESTVNPKANLRTEIVHLGCEISLALNAGWESEEIRSCLNKLEKLTGEPVDKIKNRIKKSTDIAIKIARQFGAHDASKFISREAVIHNEEEDNVHHDKKQIQFQVLQDISNLITGDIDLNLLFEMVLEGIYRGVEMDRVMFLVLSNDKQFLKEKISLGWVNQSTTRKKDFHNKETESNLFFFALRHEEGLWVEHEKFQPLYTKQIINIIGNNECFIFPVFVKQSTIGLIYADRGISKAPLTRADFTATKHFARQANIGLALYSNQKH